MCPYFCLFGSCQYCKGSLFAVLSPESCYWVHGNCPVTQVRSTQCIIVDMPKATGMFPYRQQESSTSGPAHCSSPLSSSLAHPPYLQDKNTFSVRDLCSHMHTHTNKHTDIYYINAHMSTNAWGTKSVQAQKLKWTHTHNCIIWFLTM